MGLGFNHRTADREWSTCCPHWSYGGFSRFRRALAAAEGFVLGDMQNFDGNRDWSDVDTPLKPLLNHSDWDGELTPEECAQVAPRLREIVSGWDDEYDRTGGLNLANCMEVCAADGEKLEFC